MRFCFTPDIMNFWAFSGLAPPIRQLIPALRR